MLGQARQVFHGPLTRGVAERLPFASDTFGNKNTSDRWRPHHSCWVELDELHIAEFSASP